MPAVATVLPLRSATPLIPDFSEPDHRGQRPVDERRDGDHVEALLVGQQRPRARRRSPGRLAGGDQLQRRGRVGRGARCRRRARLPRSSRLLGHVDPGVVGVGVEVERQAQRLALRPSPSSDFSPQAARPSGECKEGDGAGQAPGFGRASSPVFYRQVTTRRSSSVRQADQEQVAIPESTATDANMSRVFELGVVGEDQCPRPELRAGPLAEDGADRGDGDRDLRRGEEMRQGGRRLDPAEDLPAGGVEACASSSSRRGRPSAVRRAC